MRRVLRQLGVAAVLGTIAAGGSAATASAQPTQAPVPVLPGFGAIPWAFAEPAVGGQVAMGPTVIGSVFNGGVSVVVSNNPPIASGNVIASP